MCDDTAPIALPPDQLLPDDNVGYARFESHLTPPPEVALKPLCNFYFQFRDIDGLRMESVNCLRVLVSLGHGTNEVAAAHQWGATCGRPGYLGFNQAVVEIIEGLHVANDIEFASLQVEMREEAGNLAHCDLRMNTAPGVTKDDMNLLKLAVSGLFEATYVAR